jgi:hypothetical protein
MKSEYLSIDYYMRWYILIIIWTIACCGIPITTIYRWNIDCHVFRNIVILLCSSGTSAILFEYPRSNSSPLDCSYNMCKRNKTFNERRNLQQYPLLQDIASVVVYCLYIACRFLGVHVLMKVHDHLQDL